MLPHANFGKFGACKSTFNGIAVSLPWLEGYGKIATKSRLASIQTNCAPRFTR